MTEQCAVCLKDAEIKSIQEDLVRNSNQHREFYQKFSQLETKIAVSDERYTNLLTVMTEVKTTVNELKDKPAKKWDNISNYIITAIISLILGFLANGLFGVI
jgi:septal ring factor EnvC (AmiA/AmiB activator)